MSLEIMRMDAKFRPVFREIKALERKIYKKEGLIFTRHIYSVDELLNSEHHRRIYSYTEKIGDDIQHWYDQGKLSEDEEEYYYLKRNEVEDELEDINTQIEEREPTWWENLQGVIIEFVTVIMNNMPESLKRTLLGGVKEIIKLLRGGISGPKKLSR